MPSFLEHFSFHDPWWLLLAIPVLGLFFLRGKKGSPHFAQFSSLSILSTLSIPASRSPLRFAFLLIPLSLFALIIAMARPQWSDHYTSKNASGIDIVIALDISYSMSIGDFDSTENNFRRQRIDAAKDVIRNFVEGRPNDRIGLVAFAGRPYPGSPITLDHQWLLDSLKSLQLGDVKENGTAIGSAIAAAAKRLDKRKGNTKSKIIVLVTDGASNSGRLQPLDAAKFAQELGIKTYTIAIGTEGGRVSQGIQSFPRQEFDESTLQEIAKITQAEYFRARDTAALENTFQSINKLEKSSAEIQQISIARELFPWPAGLGLLLFLLWLAHFALNPEPAP